MALQDADAVNSPAWWMQQMANLLLDRRRLKRLATLEAYRGGTPPITQLRAKDRRGYWEFQRLARTNFARTIVRTTAERMKIRSIRTAAANDDNGDEVAWRYFTHSNLDISALDVNSDFLTFAESYVRVGVAEDGQPLALRRSPWECVSVQDPLNPLKTLAAFELLWDPWRGRDYAYLWLPGQQWVADRESARAPRMYTLPGLTPGDVRYGGYWWPLMGFDAASFTMRPNKREIDAAHDDGAPYSETFAENVVPVVRFDNRDGVGEFEEHIDVIDRINHETMKRVIISAIQAYKQRALKQTADASAGDKLPMVDPKTGEKINWDEIFEPGPDALWKLPPGVEIWESAQVDMLGILKAIEADAKMLGQTTNTPLPLLSDDTNASAEAAQLRREGLVFKVEDRDQIAGRGWAQVISLMFLFGPQDLRFDEQNNDRADAGKIVINFAPAERFSLAERSSADSLNKSLSRDMAAEKIWGLSPDEVNINRAQYVSEQLVLPAPTAPQQTPAPTVPNVPANPA